MITVAGELLVDASSRIDVSAHGYLDHRTWDGTPGGTTTGGPTGGSGGSYGGAGVNFAGSTNAVYGDPANPNEPGSGGGHDGAGGNGGDGGGVIRILAGSVRVDGQILADGQDGWYVYAGHDGGGGSGGAVRIDAGTVTGSGIVRARGGNGAGGGGGGGRIAVYTWDAMDLAAGNVTVPGGSGNGVGGAGSVVLGTRPGPTDLEITTPVAPPASAVLGEQIALAWRVENAGDEATTAEPWFDRVYISSDTAVDAGDHLLADYDTTAHAPLAGRAGYDGSAVATIPYDAPTGGAYLLFVADASGAQAEFNEANNLLAVAIDIIPTLPDLMLRAPADADFTGDDVYNADAAGQAVSQQAGGDQTATFILRVENDRDVAETFRVTLPTAAAGWQVRLFDAATGGSDVTAAAAGDGWLVGPLDAGEGIEFRLEITPDLNVPAGEALDLPVTAASAGAAENLDRVLATVEAAGGSQPNLTVTPQTVPADADWGESINLAFVVANAGPGPAVRQWQDAVYLSTDDQLDAGDTLLGTRAGPDSSPLAAGEDYTAAVVVTIPYVAFGTHWLILVADDSAEQPETDEGDNNAAVAIDLRGPELVVGELTFPAGPYDDGEQVEFWARIDNLGNADVAEPFDVRFELDGVHVGTARVTDAAGVPAGGSVLAVVDITAAPGVHSVSVLADSGGEIHEQDEANNALAAELPEVTAADLTVSDVAWSPSTILDNASVTFTATIANDPAAGSTLRTFTVRFEVDGVHVATATVEGGVAAGGSVTAQAAWTATPGEHTVRAIADHGGAVAETDEANNTHEEALPEIEAPDLRVTGLTTTPAMLADGDAIGLTATVVNDGAATTRDFAVRFEIDGGYLTRGTVSGGLGEGESTTVTATWTASPGVHTARAVADEHDDVSETDETNNALQQALPEVFQADLEPVSIAADPAGMIDGGTVTFTATIHNAGEATLRDFVVRFELDGELLEARPVAGGLAAGASMPVTATWRAEPGADRDLVVIADAADDIAELAEDNNIAAMAPFTVAAADLYADSFVADPAVARDGENVTFTATVHNGAGAGDTMRDIVVRIDVDGTTLARRTLAGGLAAGASADVSATWKATPGDHDVTIVVDEPDAVTETDEADNTLLASLATVAAAELSVADIAWVPASIMESDPVTITAALANAGGATVRDIVVRIDLDGVTLTRQTLTGLGSTPAEVSAAWTATPGDHTVTVVVDEYDAVSEGDESDNTRAEALPTVAAPNLVISDIAWVPAAPTDTDTVAFTATVHNSGAGGTSGSFHVRFELNGEFLARRQVVGGLASGASIAVEADWPAVPGDWTITATADEYGTVGEAAEADNGRDEAVGTIADETAPAITAFTPLESSKVRGTVSLHATATDVVGVTAYTFEHSLDGQSWAPLGSADDGRVDFDTLPLAGGNHLVRVTAEDAAGNASQLTRTYFVDNTPPPAETLTAEDTEFAVRLTWTPTDVTDFAYYRLRRSETPGGPYTAINGAITQESFTDRNVTVGQTYYYLLTVYDHVGNVSEASNEASASALADQTPPAIAGMTPAAGTRSATSFHLAVTAGDNVGVTRYAFEYSGDAGQSWTAIADGTSSTAEWDVTALAGGTYTVRATVEDAEGNAAALTRAYEVDHDAPATPENLRLTPDEAAMVVAWDPVVAGDFHHYALERSVDGGAFSVLLAQTSSTVYIDADVDSGVPVAYRVSAADDLGNASAASDAVSDVPLDDTTAPQVLGVTPADGTYVRGQVTLTATARDNVEIVAVRFESAPAGTDNWTLIGTDDSPAAIGGGRWRGQIVWDTDATAEGEHDIRATAVDYGANEHFRASTVIVDRAPPAAPDGLTVHNPRSGGRLELLWLAVADDAMDGYNVYRATQSAGSYEQVGTSGGPFFDDSGLTDGVTYFYTVAAFDEAGNESPRSLEGSGTPTGECDLAIEEVAFDPAAPVLGRTAEVAATIGNTGPAAASAEVRFYDGDPQTGVLLATAAVSVPAGQQRDVTVGWTPDAAGVHTITAVLAGITADDQDAGNDTASAGAAVNLAPVAVTGGDREGDWNAEIVFDATASTDDDGSVVAYAWDFGDGESSSFADTTHAYQLPGTYTARLTVTDNRGAASTATCEVTVHDTRADVIVSDLAWDPAEPEERDEVAITATLTNVGNGPTLYGFFTGFYIDGNYRGYTRVNELLDIGESVEVTFGWTATKGLHTLQVVADDIQDNIAEIDETNNDGETALTLQQIYFPDLVIEDAACDLPETTVSALEPLTATATVRNIGAADAFDFWVSLYLGDEFLTRKHVTELVVDEARPLTFTFDPRAGQHALRIVADDPVSAVLEGDETNNASSVELPELTLAYPDLAVADLAVRPAETTLADGSSLDLAVTIENPTNVEVNRTFQANYYLDGEYIGSREVRFVGARSAVTLAVQTRATPGPHTAEVRLDEAGEIAELDEANNAATVDVPELTILYPDLVVSEVEIIPANPKFGDRVYFTCTVSNETVVSTLDGFVFKIYVDGREVDAQELPRLTGHASQPFVLSWEVDVDPGVGHEITAGVDVLDTVHEEDETNNTHLVAADFHVGDNFVLDVETPGGTKDELGSLFYTNRQVAEFVATVRRGSSPEPIGPESAIDVWIDVLRHGGEYWDPEDQEWKTRPDELIAEDVPMTFNPSDRTYSYSLDLLTYGTGTYSVTIEATDGVDLGRELINMTVIEEVNFEIDTDKAVYLQGEPVRIGGTVTKLSGEPVGGQDVEILISEGWSESGFFDAGALFDEGTRTFSTTTDPQGNFGYIFQPLWGDAGHYSIDAFVITQLFGTSGHTEVAILGMKLGDGRFHVTTTKNSTYTHTVTLTNLGDDPLTGAQLTFADTDPNDNVTATYTDIPETLQPGASVPITLTVQIPEDAPDTARFEFEVTTAEGLTREGYLRFTLRDPVPVPRLTPDHVKVALNPGTTHSATVTVRNDGLGTMSGITLIAPEVLPWVTPLGPEADELAPGESTTFEVLIAPGTNVRPGIYVDAVRVTDGTHSTFAQLTVEVSSANRGSLSFVVTNDAGQVVPDAEITLVNREAFSIMSPDGQVSTYHKTFRAKTDATGVATVEDAPIGEYDYGIAADGHETVRDVAEVMPASEARVIEVEMVAVPLSYEWTVTPITIEDTYDITLTLDFAVEIPKPQFVFLPPWVAVADDLQAPVRDQLIIVNPSLIRLTDVTAEIVGATGITLAGGGAVGNMEAKTTRTLSYHIAPGDYAYLDGTSTYIRFTAGYIEFDPVTEENVESELVGKIPLVNPSAEGETVRVTYGDGEKRVKLPSPTEGEGELEIPGGGGGGMPPATVREVVTIQIKQKATLEREAFDARLELTSGYDTDMVSLAIHPRVTDEEGVDVTDRFYIVPPELDGIDALDGSANLGAFDSLTGRWILIPGDGLGGTDQAGKSYFCKAVMSYYVGGQLKETQTESVEITVHPQPKLYLHYYVPKNVLADIPFRLGLLVENEGDGEARNLKIDSAQPEIVDNEAGLLLDMRIVGSSFGSKTGDIVRLVLGDVAPHSIAHGYWIMQSSLDGIFTKFTAEFSHRAYKGVDINPLILDVTTEIIQHDYLFADAQDPNNSFMLIDRDKDGFPDYLLNAWSGLRLPIIIPQDVTVTKSPTQDDRLMELEVAPTDGYVCVIMPDPLPGSNIRSISRDNGPGEEPTVLSGNNFWKEGGNLYFVDELGTRDDEGLSQPAAGHYTIDLRSALDVEEVQAVPNEFHIIYSTEAFDARGEPKFSNPEAYEINEPPPGSALTTYELYEPVWYLDVPPTVGLKAKVRAVLTNNGVFPESGTVEVWLTKPDDSRVLLGTHYVDELRAWRHEEIVVDWTPDLAGEHFIEVLVPGDSPGGNMEIPVTVNALPYADAGTDFSSDVRSEATFDGTRSLDPDGYLITQYWDFADGVWGGGETPGHVYQSSGTRQVHLIVKDNDGAMAEDVMLITVNETRPDLVVESIAPTPAQPDEGEQVTVTALLRNIGESAVGDEAFHVGFYVDGDFREVTEVQAALAPGEAAAVNFAWTAEIDNHLFTVVADDMTDRVDEANEDNNRLTQALYPTQIYFADLLIDDVSLSVGPEDPVHWGDTIEIRAAVRNVGTRDATRFRVSFYVDGVFQGYDVAETGLPHADGSNTAELAIQWQPTEGEHVYTARVDGPIDHVVELDETNNTHDVTVGDLNIVYGDLVVSDLAVWPQDGQVDYPDELRLQATVVNDSEVDIPGAFDVGFYLGETLVGTKTVEGLAPGESQWVALFAPPQDGSLTVRAVADAGDAVPEQEEANNAVTRSLNVNVRHADLVIGSVSWSPNPPTFGQPGRFAVRIDNLGDGRTAEPFNVTLSINGELHDAIRQNVPIQAGGTRYWFVDWTPDVVGDGMAEIVAAVDPLDEVAEDSEANNARTIDLEIDSGYIIELRGGSASQPVAHTGGQPYFPGGTGGAHSADVGTYLGDESVVFTATVAESDMPAELLGDDSVSVTFRLLEADGETEVLSAAMAYDESAGGFVYELGLAAVATGGYIARIEAVVPDLTVTRDVGFSVAEDVLITLSTDKSAYTRGEPIEITGTVRQADDDPVPGADVELALILNGTERLYDVTTDAAGDYRFTLTLLSEEGGAYMLDATTAVDGVERSALTGFEVRGMFIGWSEPILEVVTNADGEAELRITNVGNMPTYDLQFTVGDNDLADLVTADLDLTGTSTDTLGPGETTTFKVVFTVEEGAEDGIEPEFDVTVTDGSGQSVSQTVRTRVVVPEPEIVVDPGAIHVGVIPGSDGTHVTITVSNAGEADLEGIAAALTTSLPWLSLSTFAATTLAPEGSSSFELTVEPGERVDPDVYEATIAVTSNDDPVEIPVLVEVTDQIVGTLNVHVADDYGFDIEGAEVSLTLVSSPFESVASDEILQRSRQVSGTVDAGGRTKAEDVLAGVYEYTASAEDHDSASGSVQIAPGETATELEIELLFKPFRLSWETQESAERQTLGQMDLSLVMTSEYDQPGLIPSKPAGEYFIPVGAGSDFAVLFLGGADRDANSLLYGQELQRLYRVLIRDCALPAENIYILYADGTAPEPDANTGRTDSQGQPVYVNTDLSYAAGSHVYSAMLGNLQSVLWEVASEITSDDHFLFYVFDHGGGAEGDTFDHSEEYVNGWGQQIDDDQFEALLSPVQANAKHTTYVFGQCYAGGILEELGGLGDDAFGMAASTHYEPAYYASGASGTNDFAFGFRRGLEAGLRDTHELFEFAYNSTPGALPGGPGGDYTAGKQHPWMAGGSFPIFGAADADNAPNEAPDTRDIISLNNTGTEDLTNVTIQAVSTNRTPVEFANGSSMLHVGELKANSSVRITFRIDAEAFWDVEEDAIFDSHLWAYGYTEDGGYVDIEIPIRVRVGVDAGTFEGRPYTMRAFAGPWPGAPESYGESFIESWFEEAPEATATNANRLGLSQEFSLEEETFRAKIALSNVLDDRTFDNATGRLVISSAPLNEDGTLPAGAQMYASQFGISALSTLPTQIAADSTASAEWLVRPGPDAGGTSDSGKDYSIQAVLKFQIDGRNITVVSPAETFNVRPAAELVVQYTIPVMGEWLDPGARFDVKVAVTNIGNGTARDLRIAFPDAASGWSDTVLTGWTPSAGPRTIGLGDVAPGATVEGTWSFSTLSRTKLSGFTSRWTRHAGARAGVTIDTPIKETIVGRYDAADLLQAVTDLEEAMINKVETDIRRMGMFIGDVAASRQEMQYIQDALTLVSATSSVLTVLSLMGSAANFAKGRFLNPATGVTTSPSVLNAFQSALGTFGDGMSIGSLGAGMVNDYIKGAYGYGDVWVKMMQSVFEEIGYNDPGARTPAWLIEKKFVEYFNQRQQYFLPLDYLLRDELQALEQAGTDVSAALSAILGVINNTWPSVTGAEALKKEIRQNMKAARNFLSLMPLPAYYPTDALYEEFTELTKDLDRAASGWGVPEYDRRTNGPIREATSWYSVGEKGAEIPGEYLPVFLQSWQFGTTFEPSYVLNTLLEHQYFQFSLHWNLVQLKWAVLAGSMASSVISMSGPAGASLGAGTSMLAMATDISLDLAIHQVYMAETWGYKHIAKRLLDLFHRTAVEESGVWRMSFDIMNHLQYLEENRLVDPRLPVSMEVVSTPDIEIADDELAGLGTAHVTVRNGYTGPLQISPVLRIYSGDQEAGSVTGDAVTVEAGALGDLTVGYGGVRSTLVDYDGHHVEVYLQVVDPATMTTDMVGPYTSHFYVGTADELNAFGQQTVRVPLADTIDPGDVREVAFVPTGSTRRLRLLLTQPDGADLDLHVYDAAGDHVGWDEALAEDVVEIGDAEYSGSTAATEWVELLVPADEEYRFVVEALAVEPGSTFALTVIEVPQLPALLQPLNTRVELETNAAEDVVLAMGVAERGKQRDVADLAVAAGDLADGAGHTIPGANVSFSLDATTIGAGAEVYFDADVTVPEGTPDGTYTGTITLAGTDAVTGADLTATVDVQIVLDTTAPDAPLLDPVDPTVTGPITVTGTTPPDTAVELLLDGEHFQYLLPGEENDIIAVDILIPGGSHELTAVATDPAGNSSAPSAPLAVQSELDLEPPASEAAVTGTAGNEGWYTSAVTVALSATDEAGGSGVAKIEYSVDGIDWYVYDGTPLAFSEEGTHRVLFAAEDNEGNREEANLLEFGVDTTAPSAVGWHSAAEHGPAGEGLLEIADDGSFSEGRTTGLSRLLVTFDEPVDPGSLAVSIAGLDAAGSEPAGLADLTPHVELADGSETVAVVTFLDAAGQPAALPDFARYVVGVDATDLAGHELADGGTRRMTALAGDAWGDMRTDNLDVIRVRFLYGTNPIDPADPLQATRDVNADGAVDLLDLAAVRNLRGRDARGIGDPALPLGEVGVYGEKDPEAMPLRPGRDRLFSLPDEGPAAAAPITWVVPDVAPGDAWARAAAASMPAAPTPAERMALRGRSVPAPAVLPSRGPARVGMRAWWLDPLAKRKATLLAPIGRGGAGNGAQMP